MNSEHTPSAILKKVEIDPILRMSAVLEATGLSRPTIYRYIDRGLFPKQRQIGINAVGWAASEIKAWLDTRPIKN